jgi:hypothetical protein
MEPVTTHEQFMLAVQNHLKEREGCPALVIIHAPHGLEIQANFMDFTLQMGMTRAAEMVTEAAFRKQIEEGYKTGENQMMVSVIKDAIDSEKKKVN